MAQNILITGAAGYIGGSLITEFTSRPSGMIKPSNITAAVRSPEQVQALTKLGVNVIQLDVSDEAAVTKVILDNKIDIAVHNAGSIDSSMATNQIKALGERRKVSGQDTFFMHSSITTMYSDLGGWPYGQVKDTDPIYEKEKELGGPHPVRLTNLAIIEQAKESGVKSIIIPVPMVYGRGSGEWRKLSVNIPASVRAGIKDRVVHKWDVDGAPPAAHISDITDLYALIVEKIMRKESIPTGEQGYYFAMAHRSPWWKVMDGLAKGLHARGLVDSPEAKLWSSDEEASKSLGFPQLYIRAMCTSSGNLVPVNAYQIGWKPKWDEKRFLDEIDDEVQAVQDLDTVKTSLFDSIMPSSSN